MSATNFISCTFTPQTFQQVTQNPDYRKACIEITDVNNRTALGEFVGIFQDPETGQEYYAINRLVLNGSEDLYFYADKMPHVLPTRLHLVPVKYTHQIKVINHYLGNWVRDTQTAPKIVAAQLQAYPLDKELALSILHRKDRIQQAAPLPVPLNPVMSNADFAKEAFQHIGKIVEATTKSGQKIRGRLLHMNHCSNEENTYFIETLKIGESGEAEYGISLEIEHQPDPVQFVQILAPDLATLKANEPGLAALIVEQQKGYEKYTSFDPCKGPVSAYLFSPAASRYVGRIVELTKGSNQKIRGLFLSLFKDLCGPFNNQHYFCIANLDTDASGGVRYGDYRMIPYHHSFSRIQVIAPDLQTLQATEPNLKETVQSQLKAYNQDPWNLRLPNVGLSWTPHDHLTEPPRFIPAPDLRPPSAAPIPAESGPAAVPAAKPNAPRPSCVIV